MQKQHIASGSTLALAALIVAAHTRDGGGRHDARIAGVALFADAGARSISLSRSHNGADRYSVYVSSRRGCDIADFVQCPGGRMFADVRSPLTVEALASGRVYYAQIEGIHAGGRSISNQVGSRPAPLTRRGAAR